MSSNFPLTQCVIAILSQRYCFSWTIRKNKYSFNFESIHKISENDKGFIILRFLKFFSGPVPNQPVSASTAGANPSMSAYGVRKFILH